MLTKIRKAHLPSKIYIVCLKPFTWRSINCGDVDYLHIHRWKYAIVQKTQKSNFYLDPSLQLSSTTGWFNTSRIDEVWLSSKMLSAKIDSIINYG